MSFKRKKPALKELEKEEKTPGMYRGMNERYKEWNL